MVRAAAGDLAPSGHRSRPGRAVWPQSATVSFRAIGRCWTVTPSTDSLAGRWYAPAPMFSRVKIAIRFFFVGLVVGVLLAPRSGRATRRLLRVRADRMFNELLDAATLGAYETEPVPPDEEEGNSPDPQPATRKRATASAQS